MVACLVFFNARTSYDLINIWICLEHPIMHVLDTSERKKTRRSIQTYYSNRVIHPWFYENGNYAASDGDYPDPK